MEAGQAAPAGTTRITVEVNGTRYERDVEARRLLIHLIRDDLDLTGSHVGCDTGNCGACSVIFDGTLVKSCMLLAVQADGATIPNPRLSFSSSDSTVLSLTPIGDTLVAQKTGDVLLTIRVVSSMVTGAAPSTQDSVHVRGGGSAPQPPCP